LSFAGFDQVLKTAGTLSCGLAALGATAFPLLAQLVFSLPGNGQVSKLIFYRSSHFPITNFVSIQRSLAI
jgi:hypothetical protein